MKLDYIIVGQGLAGSLLGYKLYKQGFQVKLIASQHIPRASEVAAGLFNPLVFKRLTKSWMLDECLPVMHDLFRELEQFLDCKLLHQVDMVKPVTEQESALWHKKMGQDNFTNYIAGIDEGKPVEGLRDFFGYGRVRQSGFVNLSLMLSRLKAFFEHEGLLLQADFAHANLQVSETGVQYSDLNARAIIFCEGQGVRQNPFFQHVGLNPVKGQLLEVECLGLSQEYILNKRLFVMPIGDNRFKIGATYEWKDLNYETTPEAEADLLERFADLVSLPCRVTKHLAGIRPTVIDRRPILGLHPTHKTLAIFNGLGTKGVMLAPYFVEEMLQVLANPEYKLHTEVDVQRFNTHSSKQ